MELAKVGDFVNNMKDMGDDGERAEQVMREPAGLGSLTSKKGWAKVAYNKTIWIPMLAGLPAGYDREPWAREFAAVFWAMSGLPHGKSDETRLATALAYLHEHTYGHVPCHLAFIHLPDPRMLPLPVHLGIWESVNERNEHIRMLTNADDPQAIERPIVDEFRTENLGPA
jgi:hypothetical protein